MHFESRFFRCNDGYQAHGEGLAALPPGRGIWWCDEGGAAKLAKLARRMTPFCGCADCGPGS
jgi:hypothetical protein